MGTTPLYLTVPYQNRTDAKDAGAWWDAGRRCWYIPPGREVNFHQLRPWIPIEASTGGTGIPISVLGLPRPCWRCHDQTTPVVALQTARGDIAAATGDFNLQVAATLLGPAPPAGIGEIRHRYSRTAGGSYLSNGCCHCGVLQGQFPLDEELDEAFAHDQRGLTTVGHGNLHPILVDAVLAFGGIWLATPDC